MSNKTKISFFTSYAHDDEVEVNALMKLLAPNLKNSKYREYNGWSDKKIPLGENWANAIKQAIETANFGLLLISSNFLASDFIPEHELAKFVDKNGALRPGKRIIPVALKPISQENMDLKGLQYNQIFFYNKKTFFEASNKRAKYQFALELFDQIERVFSQTATPPNKSERPEVLPGHTDVVNSVTFSPDDQYILSASADKTICLWQIATWRCVKRFAEHTEAVFSAAFSEDGKLIVSASADKTVCIWGHGPGNDPIVLKANEPLPDNEGEFRSANFHPNGKHVVAVDNAGMIRLWDWQSGTIISEKPCGNDILNWVTFSPDGTKIAVASSDSSAYLWDAQLSNMLDKFEGQTGSIKQVAFSKQSDRLLIITSKGTMHIWNLADKTFLQINTTHLDDINSASFSSDGKYIVSASRDHTLRLWNSLTGTHIFTFSGHTNEVMSVAFSNGKHPTANQYFVSASRDNTIRVWDATDEQFRHTCQTASGSLAAFGVALAAGKIITFDEKNLRLWQCSTGIREDELQLNGILEVAISNDGQYFATVGENYQIQIWTNLNQPPITVNRGGDTTDICRLCFEPNGKYFASFATEACIQLWDAANGEHQVTYKPALNQDQNSEPLRIDSVLGINFENNGKHTLLISNIEKNNEQNNEQKIEPNIEHKLRLWDCATATFRPEVFEGHKDRINSAFISPDTNFIVTTSNDNTIRYWETATGKCLEVFPRNSTAADCAKFSPDGKQIVSIAGGTLHILDTTTMKDTYILTQTAKIIDASFTLDSSKIFFATINGSWRLYDIATQEYLLEVWQFRDGYCTIDRKTNQVTVKKGNAERYLK